jgi:mercuric ion transport protein
MAMATTTERSSEAQRRRSDGVVAKTLLSIGGVLAALGASSCCVIPFALFMLGVSGAWIGDLTALAPYQPIFVAVALSCLAGGFVLLRRKSVATAVACEAGPYCASPTSDRIARVGLWTAATIIALALVFPRLAPLFFD